MRHVNERLRLSLSSESSQKQRRGKKTNLDIRDVWHVKPNPRHKIENLWCSTFESEKTKKSLNPLSPQSDQNLISPYRYTYIINHTTVCMSRSRKQSSSKENCLYIQQLLPANTIRNIWTPVMRICMWTNCHWHIMYLLNTFYTMSNELSTIIITKTLDSSNFIKQFHDCK